jgi:hypothetical protein
MGFGVPTTLDAIMTAISTKLVATDALFVSSQILPTLASDRDIEAMPMKDQFLAIRPRSFPVDRADRAGGGRSQFAIDGTLDLLFFSRLWAGPVNNDFVAMANATNGVLAKFKAILKSLEQFSPVNAAGDCILREPMRTVTFDIVPNRTSRQGWTRLDSTWEIKFVQSLT